MILSTLCYIEKDGCWLMLHRVKKKNDVNHDKWIGIGGKFEEGESPEDCLLRETREETGLTLTEYRFRGLVTFVSDEAPTEYMHLFTATGFTGTLQECDEGTLEWVPIKQVETLPLWQGDRLFLELLQREERFFSLNLRYEGERMAEAEWRGERVFTQKGDEVTEQFCRGAEETLRLCRLYGCEAALLKERSPSCGHGVIHNGQFDGGLVPGNGVTAEWLLQNGIAVYG